jgi:type IV secretory pathway VirJ component
MQARSAAADDYNRRLRLGFQYWEVGMALWSLASGVLASFVLASGAEVKPTTMSIMLDGKAQTLVVYRVEGATEAVILSSGDLGWAGFVVDVAAFLASQRIAVLGFNTKAYLESFTSGTSHVEPSQVPAHFETLARTAEKALGVTSPPVLVGISEGAGLSVMAAVDPPRQPLFRGVVVLGLPASTELGWRAWRDWTTWITKQNPAEPVADSMGFMGRIAPLPFVSIQSTHDEFVPLATAKALFAAAKEPKQMHMIDASNHRFSDKRDEVHARLLEVMRWIASLPANSRD